jgi:superfamily II DNA or RNA helicase
MIQLRDYQIELSTKGSEILKRKGLVYYNFSPRVGKTLTALQTCQNVNAKDVLFITKIKF